MMYFKSLLLLVGISALSLFSCGSGSHGQRHDPVKFERAEAFKQRINEENMVMGDLINGKRAFKQHCESCHGHDGMRINFGSPTDPLFLAHTSRLKPEQFFHIVNFGQNNNNMPAYYDTVSFADLADIVAYCQTLPSVEPNY
jgi:mono/diheme cytochrome c family protein